jgi:hypothetical protein
VACYKSHCALFQRAIDSLLTMGVSTYVTLSLKVVLCMRSESMHCTLHLYPSLIATDSSCFCETIGKLIMFPRNMPESDLHDVSLVYSQHVFESDNSP